LSDEQIASLALFRYLLLESRDNVSGIRSATEIETFHFLDSLSLLSLASIRDAAKLIDVGSGGGLPALVLAIALPATRVVALDSARKKCAFAEKAAETLGLSNVTVVCERAELFGREAGREAFDVAVARAVAPLSVIAELAAPLIRVGGVFVAMKGRMSNQERIEGEKALAILGCEPMEAKQVFPFAQAENRWLYTSRRVSPTPARYPRRTGTPARRPLGSAADAGGAK